MNEPIEVQGCVDCLMFSSNGEFDPSNSPERDEEISTAFTNLFFKGVHVCASGDETNEISNSPCEICDSKFAGSSHQLFLIGRK